MVIGVSVARNAGQATAVLLGFTGRGLRSRPKIVERAIRPLSTELSDLIRRVSRGSLVPMAQVAALAAQLAEQAAELTHQLRASRSAGEVLSVGVEDPGLWHLVDGKARARLPLLDAARLAKETGLTVIDAFADRDLVEGGRGGPLGAVAQSVLLADEEKNRVLFDLGRTTKLTFLPKVPEGVHKILAFDVGPGTELLDRLTYRLTEGKHRFDPGGRLAVQGRKIPALLSHLLSAPYFQQGLPRWHPHGVCPTWFLDESIRIAIDSGYSMRDLLCTSTHLIAESLFRAIEEYLPRRLQECEVVLAGDGLRNGLLLREISSRLAQQTPKRITDLDISHTLLDAATTGVLTLLALDQVSQNQTSITGTAIPRVLGRVTPGSPQNWRQLVKQLRDYWPASMPLNNAV